MSRWPPDRKGAATVLGCDAGLLAGPAGSVAAPETAWDGAALQAAFEMLSVGSALQVRVAPDLCRHFVMTAAAGVRSLAELRELAALRAVQLFGGAADSWAVVADWRLGDPFVCAALPQAMLQALRQAAGARRLSVVSALLLALERLLAAPARSGFIGFATPRHAVLVGLRAGQLVSLHAARRAEAEGIEALTAQLARDATREALLGGPSGDTGAEPAVSLEWPGPRDASSEAAWAQRLGAAD